MSSSLIDELKAWAEDDLIPGDAAALMQDAAAELARLQAVVEKLPMTADCVRVGHGETVYDDEARPMLVLATVQFDRLNDAWVAHWTASPIMGDGHVYETESWDVDCCYSTRDAAEAARTTTKE